MLTRSEWFSKFSDEGWLTEPREKVIQYQSGVGETWWDQEINSCESWTVASQRVYTRHQNFLFTDIIFFINCWLDMSSCTSGPTRYIRKHIQSMQGMFLRRRCLSAHLRGYLAWASNKCLLQKQLTFSDSDMGVTRWSHMSDMGLPVRQSRKSCVVKSHTQW